MKDSQDLYKQVKLRHENEIEKLEKDKALEIEEEHERNDRQKREM